MPATRRVRPARRVPTPPPDIPEYSVRYLQPGADDSRYLPALRQAFDFFRRHADGRYSDSTLMALTRAWDWCQYNQRDLSANAHLPVIVLADAPYEYDEETEVKRGGNLGMMVVWPEKAIMAVNRNGRRAGIGGALWEQARYYLGGNMSMWVGKTNQPGHMFCLSRNMYPTAMNGQGAVRYTTGEESVDE